MMWCLMNSNRPDNLTEIFELRKSFMTSLEEVKPGSYPPWPLDISSKKSQQVLRDTALKGIEEMFEALQHLKNWKTHRQTDLGDCFNREDFLEEMVDAFNYFFALMINLEVSDDEFYEAFLKKHDIIIDRLKTGY